MLDSGMRAMSAVPCRIDAESSPGRPRMKCPPTAMPRDAAASTARREAAKSWPRPKASSVASHVDSVPGEVGDHIELLVVYRVGARADYKACDRGVAQRAGVDARKLVDGCVGVGV